MMTFILDIYQTELLSNFTVKLNNFVEGIYDADILRWYFPIRYSFDVEFIQTVFNIWGESCYCQTNFCVKA